MSTQSSRSEQEIYQLLDEYGIKHGPVVGKDNSCSYQLLLINVMRWIGYCIGCLFVCFSLCALRLTIDSTRALYEKKILEAMGRQRAKAAPDKTYYREEQDEVTYVSYRTPIRSEVYEDGESYSPSRPEYTHRDFQDEKPYLRAKSDYMSHDFVEKPYDTPSTYRTMSYSTATPVKPSAPSPGTSRLIPLWVQLLVFLVVAVFLYFVFCNMESTHSEPFKGLN